MKRDLSFIDQSKPLSLSLSLRIYICYKYKKEGMEIQFQLWVDMDVYYIYTWMLFWEQRDVHYPLLSYFLTPNLINARASACNQVACRSKERKKKEMGKMSLLSSCLNASKRENNNSSTHHGSGKLRGPILCCLALRWQAHKRKCDRVFSKDFLNKSISTRTSLLAEDFIWIIYVCAGNPVLFKTVKVKGRAVSIRRKTFLPLLS